jgi:hypothetical protein
MAGKKLPQQVFPLFLSHFNDREADITHPGDGSGRSVPLIIYTPSERVNRNGQCVGQCHATLITTDSGFIDRPEYVDQSLYAQTQAAD